MTMMAPLYFTLFASGMAAPPLRMVVNNAMQSMQYVVQAREGHGATPGAATMEPLAGVSGTSALLPTEAAPHMQQPATMYSIVQTQGGGVMLVPTGWGAQGSPPEYGMVRGRSRCVVGHM